MLRKIFNMFSLENNGNHKILSLRQFQKMIQEFFIDFEKFDIKYDIIYAKIVANKLCDFKCFIEILYKIHKEIMIKKNNTDKDKDKRQEFLKFMDEILLPNYKRLVSRLYEYNIEKIQIFFQNYNPYENAIIGLFYESHNLLKHVKY